MIGDSLELTLDAMAHGGEAVGRAAIGGASRAVFVPYAIPGERVRVVVTAETPRYARARLVEVLTPSPVRVEPLCPHYGEGKCGGCQFQHLDTSVQPLTKGLVTLDQLRRVGKFAEPPVLEPIPDAAGWEYRNHALFRADAEGRLGFFSAESHAVYPIHECPVLHPLLNQLLLSLDMEYPPLEVLELRAATATGDLMLVFQSVQEEAPELMVDFPLSVVQVDHDEASAPLIGMDYITEIIRGREFRISATTFYQVNTPQAAHLIDLVLQALDMQPDESVLDAYCGMGMFAAFLAESAGEVVGIEASADALHDARHNLGGAEHVSFLEGPVEAVLPTLDRAFDAAVVDPPRTGLEPAALDALVARAPQRIAYVSCDPATLARDARRLVNQGYVLQWVQPVDMFPQTYHIENVALLTRAE